MNRQKTTLPDLKKPAYLQWPLLGLILLGTPAHAQEPEPIIILQHHAQTIINGDTLMNVAGAIGVNMAAGDQNQQNNSGAIAMGNYAYSRNLIIQNAIANGFTPDKASTRIQGQAFSNSSGWMAVNQASGQGNAQSNGMAIAAGARALTDVNLNQIQSGSQALIANQDNSNSPTRILEIEDSAFSGARGIMQVNQSAGTGNATSNSFELRLGVGTSQ